MKHLKCKTMTLNGKVNNRKKSLNQRWLSIQQHDTCLSLLPFSHSVMSDLFATPWTVSPPGSAVHGSFQARIPEWVAISFSRISPQPRDRTPVSCTAGDLGSISKSGTSSGEGNGYLLQYSCLGNPMDRGAWWATVHGVTKSQTQLSN